MLLIVFDIEALVDVWDWLKMSNMRLAGMFLPNFIDVPKVPSTKQKASELIGFQLCKPH